MDSRQPDLTRQRILEDAFSEIYRRGFQAASIARILADTGLTKGALYHHFPDKRSLGLAVVDEIVATRLGETMESVRTAERPAHALLDVLNNRWKMRSDQEVQLGCPLNNLMQEMSPIDEAFRTRLNAILNRWQDTIETALRRAQEAGDIRADVDCRSAALFIVSAWEGCTGIAKNIQSSEVYRSCMGQLHGYVSSLMNTR
jgi:TetR/AcrR family transcriptional regulator, transcriptional repressor for nem operon